MLAQAPLACADCHTLLAHVEGADYFELFGLPRRFDLDAAELGRRYLAISRNIHPDRHATADPQMQLFALRAAAAVNRAHDVLRDPFLRAEYLLETSGGKSSAEDKRVPPALLTQVMMLREEIEEAKASQGAAALADLRERISAERAAVEKSVAEWCAKLPAEGAGARDALRLELNSLKYWNNLLAQLK
jgi:molecular chaperone HscB